MGNYFEVDILVCQLSISFNYTCVNYLAHFFEVFLIVNHFFLHYCMNAFVMLLEWLMQINSFNDHTFRDQKTNDNIKTSDLTVKVFVCVAYHLKNINFLYKHFVLILFCLMQI